MYVGMSAETCRIGDIGLSHQARLMRKRREAQKASGYERRSICVAQSTVSRLDEIKHARGLPHRDALVNALISKTQRSHAPRAIPPPPPRNRHEPLCKSAVHLRADYIVFVDEVRRLWRWPNGTVLELIVAGAAGVDQADPNQLNLILEKDGP
jgi:hypothetical protein